MPMKPSSPSRSPHRPGAAVLLTAVLAMTAPACGAGSSTSDDGRTGGGTGTAAAPVELAIASAGVKSAPVLALKPGGTKAIPLPPDDRADRAGWHTGGVTPGDKGLAVLAGHITTTDGDPGLLKNIARTRVGDPVTIERADGTRITFTIGRIQEMNGPKPDTKTLTRPAGDRELRIIALGTPPTENDKKDKNGKKDKVDRDEENAENATGSGKKDDKAEKNASRGLVLSAKVPSGKKKH